MSGYFDDEETEPERPRRDREMTLGAGAVLGIVFGLVLLCGLCFGAGYAVGHRGSASTGANGPTPAPDQEPLQGNNSVPKPSAAEQTAPPAPPAADSPTTPDAETPTTGANPTTTQQSPGSGGQGGSGPSGPGAATPGAAPPVRSALPAGGNAPTPAQAAPNVRAALPAQGQFMVQIAAVANADDADVLVTALRRRGYSVAAMREPGDGLIHVKVGPFNSHDEASRWRDKLLGDGYNAVVQP